MSSIDFLTATARDVLARSIAMHPSLLSDMLVKHAAGHIKFARETYHADAARIATQMSSECRMMARMIDDSSGPADATAQDVIDLGTGPAVMALNVAMELQCVPRSLRADIAGRIA